MNFVINTTKLLTWL